jgi:hypothetical protein
MLLLEATLLIGGLGLHLVKHVGWLLGRFRERIRIFLSRKHLTHVVVLLLHIYGLVVGQRVDEK